MIDLEMTVLSALAGSIRRRDHGNGALLTLPLAMTSGNLVQVYVEQVADDSWFVTDQGIAAGELAMAGVNLQTQKNAGASWAQLRRRMGVSPALFRDDVRDFDLAGMATESELGRAIVAVGEGVVRGEALRALAPGYRRRRFRDVIIQAAGKVDLPVVLDAPMPTKHNGQRRVSLMVAGEHDTYVQAISSSKTTQESFDIAQSILTSTALDAGSLAIVLQRGVHLEKWQRETLEDHGAPIDEERLDAFMGKLAS